LEAFCRVYETKSFSKAGQEMFLSQPTISSHISYLERELDVVLFDRISRTAIPTRAGKLLYQKARELFRVQSETRAEIDELKNRVSGELVIGGSTIPANYFLPGVLAGFKARYPGVSIDLRVGDSSQICEQLLSGELDLGMVGGFAENPDLDLASVMRDELAFFAAPELGLDTNRQLSLEELAGFPWVMRERGSGTRLALEKGLAGTGMQIRDLDIAVQVQNTEAMVRCLLAGMGVGVTSKLAVEEHLESGHLQTLNVRDIVLVRNFYQIRHKRRTLFPAVRVFIKYVQDCAHKRLPLGGGNE